ncbi:hypothetical protein Tco_1278251 [Tanacetum coccineum]
MCGIHPKSDVRNTTGKNKQIIQDSVRTTSAVDLEEFCEKHYEKLLPIMADKYEYEKRKKEKLEEVKAKLDFGDARKKSTRAQESAYSESRTMSPRRQRRSRSPRHNPSVFTRLRRERSRSPRHEYKNKERRESTVFKRLESRGRSTSGHSDSRQKSLRYTENYSKSEDSEGGHWKSKLQRKKSSVEDDDLSQPWAAAKIKKWAMPTWCHMFNSTLTHMFNSTLTRNARVWFDDLPPESMDSYNDLREAFLKNYLQQKKCIRDPIVLHKSNKETENPQKTSYKGQEAASNQERKKVPQAWRHPEGNHRHNFKKGGGFRSQHKAEKRPDSKTEDNSKFLTGPRDIIPTPGERRGNERPPNNRSRVGDDEHSTSTWMDFMVVRSTSPFNGIIRRPGLRKMKAVPSTTHGIIKFLVMGGILTLRSSKIIPIECAMVSRPEEQPPPINKEKTKSKLCDLLPRSLDIFAWTPTDMTGVPRQIAEHKLNVRKGCPSVRQKKRGQAAERNMAINDEVSKLVTAGIMREVHYHDWLSNPVMVKKSDNSWRMCVDFKTQYGMSKGRFPLLLPGRIQGVSPNTNGRGG